MDGARALEPARRRRLVVAPVEVALVAVKAVLALAEVGEAQRLISSSRSASSPTALYARAPSTPRKLTPVSSSRSVELMRFIPCSPVQRALSRVADPHQMRFSSPGDCGCTGSKPAARENTGSASTSPVPAIAWRNQDTASYYMIT
jgi:hypothetical protein